MYVALPQNETRLTTNIFLSSKDQLHKISYSGASLLSSSLFAQFRTGYVFDVRTAVPKC